MIDPLTKIVASLDEKMDEADKHFDTVCRTTVYVGVIVSVIGAIFGLLIAFFLHNYKDCNVLVYGVGYSVLVCRVAASSNK